MRKSYRRVSFTAISGGSHVKTYAAVFRGRRAASQAVGMLKRFGFSPKDVPVDSGSRLFNCAVIGPYSSADLALGTEREARAFMARWAEVDLRLAAERVLTGAESVYLSDTRLTRCAVTTAAAATPPPPSWG